jgi:hypothetical protein
MDGDAMTFESDRIGFTQASFITRAVITIPAAAGTADTLANLASLTATQQSKCFGCKVCGLDTAGNDRAAIICGDSAGSMTQVTASAFDYTEPNTTDHTRTYFKALSGAAISNVCVLFYMTGA